MDKKKYTIIIAGGGTGGHLFPAISIIKQCKNYKSIYIGSKFGIESNLNVLDDFENKYFLDITGIQRTLTLKNIKSNFLFPYKFIKSYIVSRKIIKQYKPNIIIGTGGYCSGLPLLAGLHMGVPTLIQDQNSIPGLITRKLYNKVNKICVAYNSVENFIKSKNIILTGNPIDPNLLNNKSKLNNNQIKHSLGLKTNNKTLLFLGGSQGANAINKHLYENVDFYLKNNYQIILQCGEKNYNCVPEKIKKEKNIIIKKILIENSQWNMFNVCKIADIVIARAGALTISELTFMNKAIILIPYKYAADNHQKINAEELRKKNACIIVDENELKNGRLEQEINELYSLNKIKDLERKSAKAAFPNAAKDIYKEIKKIIK